MRNGYVIDILSSVDIQEIVKMVVRVIKISEGVIYKDKFKTSQFRKVFERLFTLRLNYKDEGKDIMQKLVKLFLKSLYGGIFRKDNTYE